jgi:hypothetical protein
MNKGVCALPYISDVSGTAIALQLELNCGYSCSSCFAMAFISASACATVVPGFKRASTEKFRPDARAPLSLTPRIRRASHSSGGRSLMVRTRGGATPTTVTASLLRRIVRPTIEGSAANLRCQS